MLLPFQPEGIAFREPLKDGSKRDCTLTIWISKVQRDRIDAIAKRNGMSRAMLVGKAVGPGLRLLRDKGVIR